MYQYKGVAGAMLHRYINRKEMSCLGLWEHGAKLRRWGWETRGEKHG